MEKPLFDEKTTDFLNFLSSLASEKNQKAFGEFLVKKGAQKVSETLKTLPGPLQEFVNECITEYNKDKLES